MIKQQPAVKDLILPTIRALQELGGESSNSEIISKIIELESIPTSIATTLHNVGPKTILEYRGAWARSCLKKFGAIENSGKGRWRLTDKAKSVSDVTLGLVLKALNSQSF